MQCKNLVTHQCNKKYISGAGESLVLWQGKVVSFEVIFEGVK